MSEKSKPSKPDPKTGAKAADPKESGQKKNPKNTAPIPLLLETSLTISRIVVIVAGTATLGISLLAGAQVWAATLRAVAATISLGLLLWMVNWMLARHALDAAVAEAQKLASQPIQSTVEKQA